MFLMSCSFFIIVSARNSLTVTCCSEQRSANSVCFPCLVPEDRVQYTAFISPSHARRKLQVNTCCNVVNNSNTFNLAQKISIQRLVLVRSFAKLTPTETLKMKSFEEKQTILSYRNLNNNLLKLWHWSFVNIWLLNVEQRERDFWCAIVTLISPHPFHPAVPLHLINVYYRVIYMYLDVTITI